MDEYEGLISRLGGYLAEIESNLSRPLADVANKYRVTAECACKAIIRGHGGNPQGLLEKLISDALKWIEKCESSRDAGLFKSEIRYLQNVGNVYSHDGAESGLSSNEGQSAAFDALVKVIQVAFFGEGDLDAPTLPRAMEERIPARTLGRAKFENPRSEEVVRLCFPKHRVETEIKRSDHAKRLVYDYVVVELGAGLTKGMIFIRSRSAIERTLLDFTSCIGAKFPDALEIITPRAYRPDGGEIDRRKSINEFVRQLGLDSRGRKIQVKYFDDFVWESCLPETFRAGSVPIKKASHFIEQTLEPAGDPATAAGTHWRASEYVAKILKNPHEYKPVNIVIGPAGIGKTTFCDDISSYINSQERKRVILLSATDFREISKVTPIDSVSDLYQVAIENGFMDDSNSIENHNFEINLACGNFILIIDGFDELESHLGTCLNFEKFMRSLTELEECFRKVLVILTVRDYDVERYKNIQQATICRLRGFSSDDTDRYLGGRLSKVIISEAKALLKSFNDGSDAERHTTIPLYASLICDYLLERSSGPEVSSVIASDSARFFISGKPLDTLVRKIVDREIAKQSLGRIGPDDFFEILIEIIRAPQHAVTKSALLEFVDACNSDARSINSTNFLRSPFLRWEGETISFRYDSLAHFFKSRFLVRKIAEGLFSASPSIDFLAEFYCGEGPLYDEVRAICPVAEFVDTPAIRDWFRGLVQFGLGDAELKLPWRKAMSAFMYWALSGNVDKRERSQWLVKYFESKVLDGFSVYGRFHPLDLRDITVLRGYIENYTSLPLCDYTAGVPVFHSCQIKFDDKSLPDKLDRSLFAADCAFSTNLAESFHAKDIANASGQEIVRDNVYKIVKVGFRANRFSWKSEGVYRNVTVVGKHSLDSYLSFLSSQGLLTLELSRAGAEPGYIVSDEWYSDARKLVEEKNLTGRMAELIADLPRMIQ